MGFASPQRDYRSDSEQSWSASHDACDAQYSWSGQKEGRFSIHDGRVTRSQPRSGLSMLIPGLV